MYDAFEGYRLCFYYLLIAALYPSSGPVSVVTVGNHKVSEKFMAELLDDGMASRMESWFARVTHYHDQDSPEQCWAQQRLSQSTRLLRKVAF